MREFSNRRNPILPLEYHVPDSEGHVMPDGKLYVYGSFEDAESKRRLILQKLSTELPTVDKILIAVMCGTRDKNIPFSDLQKLLAVLGFQCRIKGDHYIYYKNGIAEIIGRVY